MYSGTGVFATVAAFGADNTTNRDAWIGTMSKVLSTAGWTVNAALAHFDLITTTTAGDYSGSSQSTDIFWHVVRLSDSVCVTVADSGPIRDSAHGGCDLSVITGGTGIDVTNAGVASALATLFGWTSEFVATGTRRIYVGSVSNASVASLVSIGGQLSTGINDVVGGGYVATCKASQHTVFKTGTGAVTYGAGNYIQLYLTQAIQGAVQGLAIAASKAFTAPPSITSTATNGGTQTDTTKRTDYGFAVCTDTTYIYANPYSAYMASVQPGTSGAGKFPFSIGALKLIDFRTAQSQDLPIIEATVAELGNRSLNGRGLDAHPWMAGICRLTVNGTSLYDSGAFNDKGGPAINYYKTPVSRPALNWRGGGAPSVVGEPWIGWNVYNTASPGPVLGQLWDAISLSETFSGTPGGTATFDWDGQHWRRWTVNTDTSTAVTVAFAVTTSLSF